MPLPVAVPAAVPAAVIVPPEALVMVPDWAKLMPTPLEPVSLTWPKLVSVQVVPVGP